MCSASYVTGNRGPIFSKARRALTRESVTCCGRTCPLQSSLAAGRAFTRRATPGASRRSYRTA
eukprot:3871138-Lingulodinium_polyedra.AAC.1